MSTVTQQARDAKQASHVLAHASIIMRNAALNEIADALEKNAAAIMQANKYDLEKAKKQNMSESMLDRLMLNEKRINDIAHNTRQVTTLADVIGIGETWERPNGLQITCKRVPLGLIGIIYEARPNVTVDSAVLCIKSGNAVLLRGSEDAINTNTALVRVMKEAITKIGIPKDTIQLVQDTSRETAAEMMKLHKYIDVLIPRGGAGLIKAVRQNAEVPVIETGTGNCHTYIDEFADLQMGLDILINAKCSRPSVCNACETLLVHNKVALKFFKKAEKELVGRGVELRGCEKTRAIISCKLATDEDFFTEYNAPVLAVKVVDSLDEAVAHINKYGTMHSECIVTKDCLNAEKFTKLIDAAAVYVNASTRFTDGFEFGFGAEIGISTQKIHARGPMGLRELTTVKYVINGNGQIR